MPSSVKEHALRCIERGWSVIPLVSGDDPACGKTPAVAWMRYRQEMPSTGDLCLWFDDRGLSAYGVVCGCMSHLVVLDLDDSRFAAEFAQRFPELSETFTVHSGFRGTPHLYFHVDFSVASSKVRGGDLKGEGGYVVGPSSRIAGHCWNIVRDIPARSLTREELTIILEFLQVKKKGQPRCVDGTVPLDAETVVKQYQRKVAQSGQRNNSLFSLVCQLRDQGRDHQWTMRTLASIHAQTTASGNASDECFDRRYREAERTIASAYSHPPRRSHPLPEKVGKQPLDNSIREALLQQPDGAAFLRVFEGLRLLGMEADDTFTRKDAIERLRGIVGDYSIRKALHTNLRGSPLFAPATHASVEAIEVPKNKAKRCFVPQQKPTQSRKPAYRPAIVYRMPSIDELRERLNVRQTTGDAVQLDELRSPKTYRQPLERQFIKRRPGQYPQAWLAKRLDISMRSIYTYHRTEGIQSIEVFHSNLVNWRNYERLLPVPEQSRRIGLDTQRRFIEDEAGKRYPASRGVALRLMGQGHQIMLKERTVSRYWHHPLAVEVIRPLRETNQSL